MVNALTSVKKMDNGILLKKSVQKDASSLTVKFGILRQRSAKTSASPMKLITLAQSSARKGARKTRRGIILLKFVKKIARRMKTMTLFLRLAIKNAH